jgi:hypothetical protein
VIIRPWEGAYSPRDFIPSADTLQKTERACYEYMGLAWNAVLGKGLYWQSNINTAISKKLLDKLSI